MGRIGRLVGSGSNPGVGIGAAGRMMAGIVERGRGDAIRRGATVGTCTVVGIGTAVGRGTAAGSGTEFGRGAALISGVTSGGTVIAGSGSGEVTAGTPRTGASSGTSVAAASGARGEAVHATDAISAKRTSGRTVCISPHRRTKQVCGQPKAPRRKQVVAAVQSASAGLTALDARP